MRERGRQCWGKRIVVGLDGGIGHCSCLRNKNLRVPAQVNFS